MVFNLTPNESNTTHVLLLSTWESLNLHAGSVLSLLSKNNHVL